MAGYILLIGLLFSCNAVVRNEEKKPPRVRTQTLFDQYDLEHQLSLIKAAMQTRIDDDLSPDNVTVVEGGTAMLACTVINIGDKSVSWLRLREPIPQLMSLNNVTNTQSTRFRALVSDWREFVLMIKNVEKKDQGQYECQVSGPKHTSLTKIVTLTVIGSKTEILGGPDIYVDQNSRLELVCRVTSGQITPAFIIWKKEDKILKFDGGETSEVPYLEKDSLGRHLSSLIIPTVSQDDSGGYVCQPAVGEYADVTVHVLQSNTEVQAVLGEGGVESESPDFSKPVINSGEAYLLWASLQTVLISVYVAL